MPLHECLARNPARHLAVWEEWWRTEFDRPTADQFYAIRTAMEVRATRPDVGKLNFQEFLCKTPPEPQAVPQTPEALAERKKWYSKVAIIAWAGRLGCPIKGLEHLQ